MYCLPVIFTLLAYAFALGSWNDFNGNFLMTTASGGAGTVTGSVIWSYTQGKMYFSFNTGSSQSWTETYTWNSTKGFTGSGIDDPQYLFTYGSSCSPACSAASISSGIPLLNPSGPYLSAGTGSGDCKTYTPVATGANSFMTFMTASETKVCSFKIDDGRLFTLTSFTKSASTISTPSGCSCSQAVDIMFLVDHSSSIDWNEMQKFKDFVQNFINGLTISASAVNIGMTYFSRATTQLTGLNFPMTGDPSVVTRGMSGWQVPCDNGPYQCQRGGATATAYGIKAATVALYNSPRQVPKILLTLTDGATNTGLNDAGCCLNSDSAPDTFVGCNRDIDSSIADLKAKKNAQTYPHTLTMISVGIGTECTSSQKKTCSSSCRYSGHLLKFADNIPSNMLSVDAWDALQAQVKSLMAVSCSTSNNAQQTTCLQTCGGLCVCGSCSPPTGCTNTSNCFSYALTGTPAQCQPTAIPCPAQTCKVSTCDTSLNSCTYQNTDCSALRGGCNGCRRYTCALSGTSAGQCSVPDDSLCEAAVNCVQSAWGSWTPCSATCGGGTQQGTRSVVTPAKNCGSECGATSTTVSCNTQSCATPCVTTAWNDWTPCTVTCGGGTTTQTRTITANATNGGTPCGILSQSTSCNSNGCPVPCSWYEWSGFGPCTVSCGGGTTYSYRSIKVQSANGGADCTGSDTRTDSCSLQGCPVNCVWAPWGAYGACSATCGTGTQSRNRTQTTAVANGGIPCDGGFGETQNCSLRLCPVPCAWGEWGSYGPCSVTCAAGTTTRSRSITQVALNGAIACDLDDGTSSTSCNSGPCPIPCVWGGWSAWGSCSVTCGGGSQQATRNQTTLAQYGGTPCTGSNVTIQQCSTNGCPVNCSWNDWEAWSSCSKTCGAGVNTQSRTIKVAAINGGINCNLTDTTKYGECTIKECPIDCVWSAWSAYGSCSVTCGGGTQQATRNITTQPAFGGLVCGSISTQNRTCSPDPCPIPCVGDFLPWSDCDCLYDNQTKTFSITVPDQYDGLACAYANGYVESRTCSPIVDCKPVNCTGAWGPNSTCTCTGNQTFRIYSISVPAASGGVECPYASGFRENLYCDPVECPVDCEGEWTAPSTCACDNTTIQTFIITRPHQYAGSSCHFLNGTVNTTYCDPTGCPFDCRGHWGAWDTCTCDTKLQGRTYIEDEPLLNGGKPCEPVGGTNQSQPCDPVGCDVDCEGFYSEYTECACATNITTRYWTITREHKFNGARCNLTNGQGEDHPCVAQGCPADCEGFWGPYGNCSCANNLQNRTFVLQNIQRFGGKGCEAQDGEISFRTCAPIECPEPCVGEWAAWSECSCQSSSKSRTFLITKDALFDGEPCLAVNNTPDSTGCTPSLCPINCSGVWSNWSDCSCATGNETRSFSILIPREHAGEECLFENQEQQSQSCNTSFCPVDCQGNWNEWQTCSCLNQTQPRTWNVTVPMKNGGVECPGQQVQGCAPIECPVDCQGYWEEWGFCPCGPNGATASSQNRTFIVLIPAEWSGKTCEAADDAVQNRPCTAVECPIDCQGNWGAWGNCSCETLTRSRNFAVTRNQAFGGKFCEAEDGDSRSESCEPENCKSYPPPCNGTDDTESCVDASKCTQNRCILFDDNQYHCDWSVPVDCNDNSVCTSESCDELQGCIYVPLICNDNNACSKDTCDNVTGCKFTNITCTINSTEWCSEPICNSVTGCGKAARICPDPKNETSNCTSILCDSEAENLASACGAVQLCGFDPIFIAITGAAIAGIAVACGLVALGAVSGASFAIATQTGVAAAVTTQANPLYVADASSGVNQLGEFAA